MARAGRIACAAFRPLRAKALVASLALAGLASGCASSQMKATPFWGDDPSSCAVRAEDRVNLWPMAYSREPTLSVLWPIFSKTDAHWSLWPLYSQYRQGGRESAYDEFNVLWPLCQLDTRHEDGRVFPVFWGKDSLSVFPVLWWRSAWLGVGPFVASRKMDWGTLFPLVYWNRDRDRYWGALGLCGYDRAEDGAARHWLLPLYLRSDGGFFSAPYSRHARGSLLEEDYLCGIGGREWDERGYVCSWAFPLYYHDRGNLCTFLYGKTERSDWLMPFYVRNQTDMHTLLGSVRDDARTGERGFLSLPLLTAACWRTNGCARSWCSLLGLVGGKTDETGASRQWALPLYHREAGRSFTSLPFGWNVSGGTTNVWCAAGLAGRRSGANEGGWLFPLFSRRTSAGFDECAAKLDAPNPWAALTAEDVSLGFRKTSDLSFLLLWNRNETVSCRGIGDVALTRRRRFRSLLLDTERTRSRTFDHPGGERQSDVETCRTSACLSLYLGETKRDLLKGATVSARHRVLWKLWDWERKGEDVSLDAFPFLTHDEKANGHAKTSLLWRLYRNERDPAKGREIDLLFIPVWR